jgi:tetratricopeptide (TPR) repeat protein
LEEVLLKGDWQTVRRETKADSPNLIDRFLHALSEDFVGEWDDKGVWASVGEDSTAVDLITTWVGQLIEGDFDNPTALYIGGATALLTGEYEAAINIFSEVIQRDPGCEPAYALRAMANHRHGNLKFALSDYTVALQLDSTDWTVWSNRAITNMESGDNWSALEDLNRAAELRPRSSQIHYNRGNAESALNMDSAAIVDYTLAIEFDSNNVDAYYNRAGRYADTELFELAGEDYQRFLSRCPFEKVEQRSLAREALMAVRSFARQKTPNGKRVADLLTEGAELSKQGKYVEAVKTEQSALALDTSLCGAYVFIASDFFYLKMPDSMYAYANSGIDHDSTCAIAWTMRGASRLCYDESKLVVDIDSISEQRKLEICRQTHPDFMRSIELDPDLSLAYYYRSRTYLTMGDTTAAISDLERFLRIAERKDRFIIQKAQTILRTLRPD